MTYRSLPILALLLMCLPGCGYLLLKELTDDDCDCDSGYVCEDGECVADAGDAGDDGIETVDSLEGIDCPGPTSAYSPKQPPRCGPADAPVTIVYYADLQGPYTRRGHPPLFSKVLPDYADRVKVLFRFKPLPFHDEARQMSRAALAAHRQGKFWLAVSALLDDQFDITEGNRSMIDIARDLDLDVDQFQNDLSTPTFTNWIDRDLDRADGAGIEGTPTFVIDGEQLDGAQPASRLRSAIEAAL